MKKILTLFLSIAISASAQISLESVYPTGSVSLDYLRLTKLSSSGYKYVTNDKSKIILYNLNHTVFKTINFPPLKNGVSHLYQVYYISEELFNLNPDDIEFFLLYSDTLHIAHAAVLDEFGNILLMKDSAAILFAATFGNEEFISQTPLGAKMVISCGDNNAFVYALPGFLPCHDCSHLATTSEHAVGTSFNENIANYPNPTIEQTTIEYTLPEGVRAGEIVFYNTLGQEIKRFKVTDAFQNIIVSTNDLDEGTYFYQLQTDSGFTTGKKMLVIK
jgi:hypothetical protein